MKRNRLAALVLCLVVVTTFLSSCGSTTPSPTAESQVSVPKSPEPTALPVPTAVPTEKPGGDLRIAVQEDANVLNPYLAYNTAESFCVGLIYDTLLGYDSETGQLEPGLADSWEWDPGFMGMTFKLNPEAKWHDGEAVTADDVVFSFTYLSQTQFPIFFAIARNYGGIEKVDNNTVHITFNYPQVDAPRFIGTVVSIIPQHIWKDIEDGQNFPNTENPIGSGPFALKEKVSGQHIILQATHQHYRLHPKIDTISLRIVSDETVGIMSMKNGDFDVLFADVSPDVAAEVRDKPGDYPNILLAEAQGLDTRTLLLNLRKAPYDNVEFRKALAQAINVDTIISKLMLGFAEPVGPGLFPPAVKQWYNPDIPLIKYDPEAAKAALEAAGFKDANSDGWREMPDGTALSIPILCTTDPTSQDMASYIVADLGAVNIQATVDPVDPMGMRPRLETADFDAVLSGVNLSEPGMIAYYLGSDRGVIKDGEVVGMNYGGYASTVFDEAAQASRTAFDLTERQALLFQGQVTLAADLPQIPLYIPKIINLYRADRFDGWVIQGGSGIINNDTIENLTLK